MEKLIGCEEMYTRIAEEIKQKKIASEAAYNEIKSTFEFYEKDDLTPEQLTELDQQIKELVEARTAARAAKDWAKADEIRDTLSAMGVIVEDTKDGPKILIKK